MRFRVVDLPLPDGPTTETISPASTRRSMPRNAGYSRRPVRYTFSTARSSMSGATAVAPARSPAAGAVEGRSGLATHPVLVHEYARRRVAVVRGRP
jgi:hypothetical protein